MAKSQAIYKNFNFTIFQKKICNGFCVMMSNVRVILYIFSDFVKYRRYVLIGSDEFLMFVFQQIFITVVHIKFKPNYFIHL